MAEGTTVAKARIQEMVMTIESQYLGSAEDAIANMAFSILEASEFDDMFNEDNVPQKLFDTDLRVEEITFNRSNFEGGIPYFATFRGKTVKEGDPFLVNLSAWQPVVVAYKCLTENWLPRNLRFHKAEKATARGFFPVTVQPVEEPF